MIKLNIFKDVYNFFSNLDIILVLFLLLIIVWSFFGISYGQNTISEESEITITSYLDAIIKAPLLISQAFIVGVSFVNLFLFIWNLKKAIFFDNNSNNSKVFLFDILNNKLYVTIIIVCGFIILIMSMISIIFQSYILSFDLGLDSGSTLIILLSSSVGNIFTIKLITSILIIITGITYFFIDKRYRTKILKLEQKNKQEQEKAKKQKLNTRIYLTFCISILILGSINIFSNSIQSHNAAVDFFPYIAISVDWIHFMMVSIWVGGLFYISLNLSRNKFHKENVLNLSQGRSPITNPSSAYSHRFYLLTILRFSIIAVISLGLIFITGLYMGLLQLQQPSSLLNSNYGNILIVKLLVVFSMAILGGYHHFKISILFNREKEKMDISQQQKLKKFNKTLKIEYILGICIIFISSFLTITSPPQHESHNMNLISMNQYGDSDIQKFTDGNNQYFDKTFSLIALAFSILIAILIILFVRRRWITLKLFNQVDKIK